MVGIPSLPGREPVGGEPLMSVTLLGDRGTCVLTTCPGSHSIAGGWDSTCDLLITSPAPRHRIYSRHSHTPF